MFRDSRWYYIWNMTWRSSELYNLKADPEQRRNIVALNPEVAKKLKKNIEIWRITTIQAVQGRAAQGAPPAPPATSIQMRIPNASSKGVLTQDMIDDLGQ